MESFFLAESEYMSTLFYMNTYRKALYALIWLILSYIPHANNPSCNYYTASWHPLSFAYRITSKRKPPWPKSWRYCGAVRGNRTRNLSLTRRLHYRCAMTACGRDRKNWTFIPRVKAACITIMLYLCIENPSLSVVAAILWVVGDRFMEHTAHISILPLCMWLVLSLWCSPRKLLIHAA